MLDVRIRFYVDIIKACAYIQSIFTRMTTYYEIHTFIIAYALHILSLNVT